MNLKILRDNCGNPYMARLEIARLFNWSLKLHIILRSDTDKELHDHPWDFWSLVICGKYYEFCENNKIVERKTRSLEFRPADWKHRVVLDTDARGYEKPCATLVLTSPVKREWGFWRLDKFIPWRQFDSQNRCD